jgi:lon-related putative ATP-dependent protease
MKSRQSLEPYELLKRCDASAFDFRTTAELEAPEDTEQDRADEALRFGIGMRRDGYNVFVMGPQGAGKRSLVDRVLATVAAAEVTPPDRCYVHNFEHPHKPRALELPAGGGRQLCRDMERLVEDLQVQVPLAFESDEYRNRVQAIEEEFKERQESAIEELTREAESQGVRLLRTPSGFAFAPVVNGEVVGPEEFAKLHEDEQQEIREKITALQARLEEFVQGMLTTGKESQTRVREISREVTHTTVVFTIAEIKTKYADNATVLAYLEAVEADVVEHVDAFRKQPEAPAGPLPFALAMPGPSLDRYRVNTLVEHTPGAGAPTVHEDHPTLVNLVGRVEQRAQFGALTTDFTLIKAGALHRAAGGYLILDVRKLLLQPFAYEALKAALTTRVIRIESPAEMFGVSTVSLEPEEIPLEVKVILVGDRQLYYRLYGLDPEFSDLFKVSADFADRIDRDGQSDARYARIISGIVRTNELRHLDRDAVARMIEHGARRVQDAEKLSAHKGALLDLLREADYWAGQEKRDLVTAADIDKAVDKRIHRVDRVRSLVHEQITRGTVNIRTEGEAVGQINGLAVLAMGDFGFGRPSRITATARLGRGQIVDIERQVKLGGPTHSKGVLILSSFLADRYAREQPLSLNASLVFEQSYGGVDGDSASVAETCALLSALSGVPIQQSLAITGSIDQHGSVQAIGGVNEKIEGFFDVCSARGLTGGQGVVIPAANVKHLMLRADVVDAAAAGRFRVYAVETVDEALTVMTGVEAGEPGEDGRYPDDTVNRRVADRLDELSALRRKAARGGGANRANDKDAGPPPHDGDAEEKRS